MKFICPTQNTPVVCQGITGSMGAVHTEMALVYGTKIVAGVAREKGLSHFLEVPVFASMKEAVRKKKPEACVIFSTPARALADVEEAAAAKIPLIVCTTEHVAVHDAVKMKEVAIKNGVCLLGPNSPGVVSVGRCLVGTMPAHLFPKGNIGIVARSSSLTYEAVQQLAEHQLGVSTCVALGTAPIMGTDFIPVVQSFLSDPKTKAILVIGELKGELEIELAEWYKTQKRHKPLIVYIAGKSFAQSKKTPLVGANHVHPKIRIAQKQKALIEVGATIVPEVDKIGAVVMSVLEGNKA